MSGSDEAKYYIDPDRCISCGACAIACPQAAVMILPKGKRVIAAERCNGCGICIGKCIGLAISRVSF